jgi:hypothetical protein
MISGLQVLICKSANQQFYLRKILNPKNLYLC